MAYRTIAKLVIIPMQDILSLGSEARLNEPGHPFGNWTWRMTPWQLQNVSQECSHYLRNQAEVCGRIENIKVASSLNK
jgi:4-alpha-glucanotransferase